ncbi:MAG: CDF family Co(II)/Ni(II) efflux transporter DmeF [Gemmobacter sp.]
MVVAITTAMMVAEIVAGTVFGSLALMADGWHMFTHASALMIAALAYRFARTQADDPRFRFGTGKLGDLAAFASAVVLAVIALLIAWESVQRLAAPVAIDYDAAILVAVLGLVMNLVCALVLHDGPHHGHAHGHAHGHHGHGHAHHDYDHPHDHDHPRHDHPATDNNLRGAYLHVMADALTSVLAIGALVLGRLWGAPWLDPVIGLVGGLVIARWSLALMRDEGRVLVDAAPDPGLIRTIRAVIETGGDRISDLHVWQLGPGHHGAILSVVSGAPQPCAVYRDRLSALPGISHITVEVHRSPA